MINQLLVITIQGMVLLSPNSDGGTIIKQVAV
jgi:hypothetical protein